MAAVLPVDASISILNPVIATGSFPSNLCALKILRDLADQQGKDFNDHHLDILMPNIARVSHLPTSHRFDTHSMIQLSFQNNYIAC